MKNKTPKIKPYHPLPYRDGNTVNHVYQNVFLDRVGNLALIKKCDYKDKKNKINEGYSLQVKWIREGQYFSKEKAQSLNECVITGVEGELFKEASFKPLKETEDADWLYITFDGIEIYFFEHQGIIYLNYYWDFSTEEYNDFVFFEIGSKEEALKLNSRLKGDEDSSFEDVMELMVARNSQPILHSTQMTHDFLIGGVLAKIHVNAMLEKYKVTPYYVTV